MRFVELISLALVAFGVKAAPVATAADNLVTRSDVVWPKGQNYMKVILDHHNAHRANHSSPNLKWGHAMFENAQVLAERCVFQHNTTIGEANYGQNIAAGTAWSNLNVGQVVTDAWYHEESTYAAQYGLATPDMSLFEDFGHFTQVVWKGSKTVGCTTVDCAAVGGMRDSEGNALPGLDYFTVCNYWPAGNVLGAFAENVLPSLGEAQYTAVP